MDSYNAKYPIQYYEIGTPYQFYVSASKIQAGFGKLASNSDISEYAKYFDSLSGDEAENNVSEFFSPSKSSVVLKNLIRLVGVVVGKKRSGNIPMIEVMFKIAVDNQIEYRILSYVVESSALTDDKEFMQAKTMAGNVEVGELTKSHNGGAAGELTRSNKNSSSSSIGELTRSNRQDVVGSLTRTNKETVGSLTRSNKEIVGTLTRTKK